MNWIFAVLTTALLASISCFAQTMETNSPPKAYPASVASLFVGETNAISGKVAQVTFRERVVYLNLEKPYPDMVCSGVIFATRTNQFEDLEKLQGRTVVITGKITQYNDKPQIVIDTRDQLQVLDEPDAPMEADRTGPKNQASPIAKPVAAPVQPANNIAPIDATARAVGSNWSLAAWCITGVLIVITALLAWLIVMLRRSGLGTPKALLPGAALFLPAASLLSDGQPRALANAAPADPQAQLREKLKSELAEFAKQSLVQGLYSERNKLLEAQQQAQQELARLETHLASLDLPLQERLRAYQTRITELEKELETRDAEMREMIQATLLLIRERMEKEKTLERSTGRLN